MRWNGSLRTGSVKNTDSITISGARPRHFQHGDCERGGRAHDSYDRRALSYARTFDDPNRALAIRTIEWLTGKPALLRMVRDFERRGGMREGPDFWRLALETMEIEVRTPAAQIANIPAEGPVIVVANHPHGLVDGMVLADLIGRVREDYRILARSVLTGLDATASRFMIPVPFAHDADAQRRMVAMRAEALGHLAGGGLVALFPAGVVMSSDSWFGPAVERDWNVFTAQLIRRSGARVVPVFFPGRNSRLYQIAAQVSPVLRQGLLLHEVVRARRRPQAPVIGRPLAAEDMERLEKPSSFMVWLRGHTLSLGADPGGAASCPPQRVGTGASPR